MKTKIYAITIINKEGTKTYYVGNTYNGLTIDKILDNSVNLDDEFTSMFIGVTKDKAIVFELINAPIDVQYQAI